MIRGLITICLVLILLGACLGFMTRCTACVICAPGPTVVSDTIRAEALTGKRPNWKKYKRKPDNKKRESDDDEIGRPRFIFVRQTNQEAI